MKRSKSKKMPKTGWRLKPWKRSKDRWTSRSRKRPKAMWSFKTRKRHTKMSENVMPGKRTKTNDWFNSKKKKDVLNNGLSLG